VSVIADWATEARYSSISVTHKKAGDMVADKSLALPPTLLTLVCGDVPRFSDQPKVHRPNDQSSSRMNDEGCPNESPSVDDATGYSQEEKEA